MIKHAFIKIPLFGLLLVCVGSVWAANNKYSLKEKTYIALKEAQELMVADNKNVDNKIIAETKLKALLAKVVIGSYDMAVTQQILGRLYSLQGQYKKAGELFQQAIYSKALPKKVSHNLRYNTSQLLLADGQYKKAISLLEKWFNNEKSPSNNAYALMATAYYQLQNYKRSIYYIRMAINANTSAKESWYQVLLSSHLQLKQYNLAIKVLENLITRYPHKAAYWKQLSRLYLQQNKEFTALSVTMLAQRLQIGDAKTLMNLINMYNYLHIPYKSAQILKTSMDEGVLKTNIKTLNNLANNWIAAKEAQKADEVFKQLTTLDVSGKSDLKYGQMLFNLGKWNLAVKSLSNGLNKLKGEKTSHALLLLGMAQFQLGHLSQAEATFNKAGEFQQQRDQVAKWLHHIKRLQYINRQTNEESS